MSPIFVAQNPIRWDEVHRRLEKSEDSLGEALSASPERVKAVFRRRALHLARQDADGTGSSAPAIPAMVCRAGGERYAIALDQLAEVVPFRGCTPVPGARPELLGVIGLRGEIRPVIDLARILSGISSSDSGVVLILRSRIGLKVEHVEDLRQIQIDSVQPDQAGAEAQERYLRRVGSGTLALLDAEAMLSVVLSTKFSPKESPSR